MNSEIPSTGDSDTEDRLSRLPFRPDWAPVVGHRLRRTGVHFDALRVAGVRGEEVARTLVAHTDNAAGPVVCEAVGFRWMYFLLPPGTVTGFSWPPGAQRFGQAPPRTGTRTVCYIGIPALSGNTWPLSWYSKPTPATPFVDPRALHATVREVTGRRSLRPVPPRAPEIG